MTVELWSNKNVRGQFFDELRMLLEKYPNIANHMAREHEEDPSSFNTISEDYPQYNPESPVFLQGIVLVLCYANMENFETLAVLEPYEQSHYMSNGMLNRASVIHGVGEE